MNKLRRKDLREITDQLETLQELLQELQEQEEEYRDNMPENLQGSEKYRCGDSGTLQPDTQGLRKEHFT